MFMELPEAITSQTIWRKFKKHTVEYRTRSYLESVKHLTSNTSALSVARRRNSHGKSGRQQLGMLGNQGT